MENSIDISKKKRIILTIIYAAVIVYLSLMDVATGQLDAWNLDSVKATLGIVIAVVILSCYKLKDFLKWQYYVWLAFSSVMCIVLYFAKFHIDDNRKRWLFFALGFIVYGLILLREILGIIETKKLQISKTYILWVYMLFWMMISRYEVIWPVTFGIIFTAFYLADMGKERHEIWMDGVSYGLIASFIILQLLGDLFRPFDSERYKGIYENSNMAALFYCLVLVGFIYRLWKLDNSKENAIVKKIAVVMGISWVIGHMYLTCSRTGAMVAFVLVMVYGICGVFKYEKKKKIWPVAAVAVTLIMSLIFFPISYYVVRYVPAVTHHRITFPMDNREYIIDPAVDPIDSEKYTSFDYILSQSIFKYFGFGEEEAEEQLDVRRRYNVVYAAELDENAIAEMAIPEPGSSFDYTLIEGWGTGIGSGTIRAEMWRYYLSRLNMMGHPASEVPVWVHKSLLATHTQNILIQMAYCYGTPVGILWIIFMTVMLISALIKLIKGDEADKDAGFMMLLFITAFGLFGMTELTWNVGQLGFTLFFIFLREVFVLKEPRKIGKEEYKSYAI